MEDTDIIEEEKKPKKWRKPLIIVTAAVGLLLSGLLFLTLGMRSTFGGYIVDSENAAAKIVLKASNQQVEDYYTVKGTAIPADKEYYVRYRREKGGYVNEPCELLPESAANKYYSGDNRDCYAVVRFKNGKAVEAWQSSAHELTDDELRHYDRHEQQEEFNKHLIKGAKGIIGYYNAEQGDTYIH